MFLSAVRPPKDPNILLNKPNAVQTNIVAFKLSKLTSWKLPLVIRVGPQDEKSSNPHITADSTGSIHKNARGKKFDPKKVRLGCGNLI